MKKIVLISVILVLVIAAGIFGFKTFTENSIKENTREFNVKTFRFGYTPDVIEINKGDKVKINIENTDVLHGIRIPELNVKGNDILEFTADKTGEFIWYCTNMCGEGHKQMKGKLVVK